VDAVPEVARRSAAIRTILVAAVVALALLALTRFIGQRRPDQLPLGPPTVYVPEPSGVHFRGAVWSRALDDLVIYAEVDGQPWRPRLYAVHPDGTGLRQLPIFGTPTCAGQPRDVPTPLPDGRVVYVGDCSPVPAARGMDEEFNAIAYDPRTHLAQPLLPYTLPPVTHTLTFSPDEREGLALQDGTIGGALYWLYPDHLAQTSIALPIPHSPSWSPDGRTIALSGVADTLGRLGASRLGLPARIYLMDPDGGNLRPILDGIIEARTPSWSPDSRDVIVLVEYSLREGDGADVLIDVPTGRSYALLSEADYGYGDVLWSPDGRKIAKVAWDDSASGGHPKMAEGLYIFDASHLSQALRGVRS
jgi:hypothetical protein